MSTIITCTTPTITYTFSTVDPSTFTDAYLTITMGDSLVVERDISTATIGESTVSWTLTQAETLQLKNDIVVQVNWLTSGVRGASGKTRISIAENLKDEVI